MITVGSVCSGIEAASVAWRPLGMRFAWVSEIERFPCAVLDHHYPETPNLGDITKITETDLEQHRPIDLLVGGTPCQSFSVAGLRKGLADPRGNLALRFIQLAGATRARWLVWENVPGVLSSGEGRDFGAFLGGLAQLGYGFAYRILDAQYFGVPQRRRRVFVVSYFGDWRRAAAVLFERESLRRNPPPSGEAGAEVAGTIAAGAHPSGFNGRDAETGNIVAHTLARGACGSHGWYNPNGEDYVIASTLRARDGAKGVDSDCTDTIIPIHNNAMAGRDDARDGAGIGEPGDPMFTLGQRPRDAIAFDTTQVTSAGNYSNPKPGDPCHPLADGQHPPAVAYRTSGNCGVTEQGDQTAALNCGTDPTQQIIRNKMAVRRLTPVEAERLQGFPDDWTKVPYRGKPAEQCPDGPRYKALGNSMAVPVMQWLGQRILEAEQTTEGGHG